MHGLGVEMGVEAVCRSVDWQACALVECCHLQKRFWHHNRTFDVTSGAFDMSNRVMNTP